MMLEKAIKLLKQYQGYEPMFPDGETLKHAFDLTDETVDTLLTALRPISREQVEKVWRGECDCTKTKACCTCCSMRCQYCIGQAEYKQSSFCMKCGRPLTDEAVDILLRRLEALHDNRT